MYCGTWVVLPEPVSPYTKTIWCVRMASTISLCFALIGKSILIKLIKNSLGRVFWINDFEDLAEVFNKVELDPCLDEVWQTLDILPVACREN